MRLAGLWHDLGKYRRVLAYLIASHYAGLYDWNSDASGLEARLALEASRTGLAEALAAAAHPKSSTTAISFRTGIRFQEA